MIPRSMMSPASSGGVRSSVSFTAATIWLIGSWRAPRTSAEVHDHAPRGPADGQPGADRGGHGFLDELGLAGAGREAGLLHCTLLDPGDAGGHAHHHARMGESVLVDPLYEVPQHLFRDVEIGDHTILQGPDGTDRPGGAAPHPLRLYAH